ncbi:MAG: NAD(P)-binding domain-containing protein [Phycisphaerales bacterium]|nr:NAD(P)-binding domain-containing protein [Phycisphaerales bacterium]
MHEHDVVIVGAGPIGIELGVELKRRGLDFAILDAGPIGSTMQWWAPETRFFSSPERIAIAGVPLVAAGQDKATREEYLSYLRTVVGAFNLPIETYTRVVSAVRVDDGFELTTLRSAHGVGGPAELTPDPLCQLSAPIIRRARRLVLAIGDMHRPRMLGVEGENLPNVSHFFHDPHFYFNSRVLIVGGKNSAVEAAIRCYRAGCDVSISYRGARFDTERVKYWLLPEIEWLIRKGQIRFYPGTVPARLMPQGALLRPRAVTPGDEDNMAHLHEAPLERGGHLPNPPLESNTHEAPRPEADDAEPRFVAAEHILLLTGYVQDPTLFETLGVQLCGPERKPRIHLDTMETNVPGCYVIGTATAGTQSRARVFIETSHVHVQRVADALQGIPGDHPTPQFEREES